MNPGELAGLVGRRVKFTAEIKEGFVAKTGWLRSNWQFVKTENIRY